jgi:cell shape-determining protein MreD
MFLVLLLALCIAILLEGTLTTMPLVFILLLCYDVLNRSGKVFYSAFAAGILLDIVTVRPIGASAIYFILFFALLLLYQSKYEIRSYFFVAVSSLVGSYMYLSLLAQHRSLAQALLSSCLAVGIYAVGRRLRKKDD